VAHVLTDEVVAARDHEVAPTHVAHLVQDHRHAKRHRRLAGARAAGEAHVKAGPLCGEPELLAEPRHQQQRRDLPDPALDGREADQLALELLEPGRYSGAPRPDRRAVLGLCSFRRS
jgi:hypothetical protein